MSEVRIDMGTGSYYSTDFNVITVEKEGAVHKPLELKKPFCIQGMPGVAMCGKAATDHMIEALKAEKMYEFYFYDLSPHVKVDDNGYMSALKIQSYLWKGKQRDLVFITGDGQPANGDGINAFSHFIAERLKDLGIRLVISLAASPIPTISLNPKVYVAATSKSLINFFVKHGAHMLTEGTIVGMNGIIPCLAQRLYGIPGCILLAEACQALPSDPSASKAFIDILNSCFNLKVDAAKLSSAIEKLLEVYGVKGQKKSDSETEYIS
jgi:proteasome assembly chaperone (PAC2) family protein